MSNDDNPAVGSIVWRDLTVPNAEQVRDFYRAVVGWTAEPVAMDGYDDFNMTGPDGGEALAGICHARGPNAKLPAQWLMYITVADLDESIQGCTEMGGKVIDGPRALGDGRACVIQDPAGAVAALYS